MSIQFLVTNNIDHKLYDITNLIIKITWTDVLNNGCSKLDFSHIDGYAEIGNGSVIQFLYDNQVLFYGFVFKTRRNSKKEIQVTAYDQLRYLKTKDSIVIKDMTLGALIKNSCKYFNLKWGIIADTKYKLIPSIHTDKTWLDIFYSSIKDTLLATGEKYCVRDEAGHIALRNLKELNLSLVIGDSSLCYDYDYEKSIDDGTYNLIVLTKKDEKEPVIAKDEESFKAYGILQYFESVDQNVNNAQLQVRANEMLRSYNREKETLQLKCIGDTRVRAGNRIFSSMEDLRMNRRLVVDKVTHTFKEGSHTMDLELIL
ncbi:XkdQ/YqbQ family protein [Cellulosilyticum sp. I15G10I2]|uniref:XkdQ/YqbQ family protein n=1 Tax=Cellulosilyticum sp. I15G10I2 TaxID=1892843 RepID=UPI00085C7AC3|nr:hypothetical protein [Cellulosilyticum sp. I15G10I2]